MARNKHPEETVNLILDVAFRLFMEKGYEHTSIQDIINHLTSRGVGVLIYEPTLNSGDFNGVPVTHDLDDFKKNSSIIVANRIDSILQNVKSKIYTRDLFSRD